MPGTLRRTTRYAALSRGGEGRAFVRNATDNSSRASKHDKKAQTARGRAGSPSGAKTTLSASTHARSNARAHARAHVAERARARGKARERFLVPARALRAESRASAMKTNGVTPRVNTGSPPTELRTASVGCAEQRGLSRSANSGTGGGDLCATRRQQGVSSALAAVSGARQPDIVLIRIFLCPPPPPPRANSGTRRGAY